MKRGTSGVASPAGSGSPRETRRSDDGRIVRLHDAAAFEAMRKAGRLAAEVLDFIAPHVVPGVATGTLDRL